MTKTLTQIQKQIEVLKRKADEIKRKEVGTVIERIKEAIRHYGITAADLGLGKGRGNANKLQPAPKVRTRKMSAGKAKFRDATGRTWTGRGRRPQWYIDALAAGKKPEDMMMQ
jgi:DNA-binding protein H-NS